MKFHNLYCFLWSLSCPIFFDNTTHNGAICSSSGFDDDGSDIFVRRGRPWIRLLIQFWPPLCPWRLSTEDKTNKTKKGDPVTFSSRTHKDRFCWSGLDQAKDTVHGLIRILFLLCFFIDSHSSKEWHP